MAASKLFQELSTKDNVTLFFFCFDSRKNAYQSAELRANLLASYVAQGAVKEALSLASATKDATYEFTYNVACAQIEAGNLPAAIEALNAAESTDLLPSILRGLPSHCRDLARQPY